MVPGQKYFTNCQHHMHSDMHKRTTSSLTDDDNCPRRPVIVDDNAFNQP